MKLFKLLKGVKCRVLGSMLLDVEGLYHNDKDVKKGGMYFCLNGLKNKGVEFVFSALDAGAVVVVAEKEIQGLHNVTQVLVKDARKAMSLIADNFYDNPSKKLKLIGVTGTNGKTTTTYMISGLLNSLGCQSAIVGTNGVIYKDKKIETGMTTPDPIELNKILNNLVHDGIEYVCMEVSAHSIYLRKIDGLMFEVMIFSNLTEDHLDFFGDMQKYFEAKKKVFSKKHSKCAIINIDDEFGQQLAESINMPKKTYSIYNKSDYQAENLGVENYKQEIKFNDINISSKFLGGFNIYNLISALACLNVLKFNLLDIQALVDRIDYIPGRFNTIAIKQKLFIIDYAHTPDGLENVLKLCKTLVNGNKLLCVFGCGGDREAQKRPKMGEISTKYADFTIITSDNPRFESRLKIAKEIESGVVSLDYKVILDRSQAIKFADKITKKDDVILIAGKGAEKYIDELGLKTKYSDYEQVENLRK